MFKKLKKRMALQGKVIWLYTHYQLVSKLIMGLLVFPVFSALSNYLIRSTGRTNISSGDFMPFLLSWQGVAVLFLGLLVIILILGIDINAFIAMSALLEEGRTPIRVRDMLVVGLKSVRYFFAPRGLLLALYVALVLPLLGIGISLAPFQNLAIPNFISSVIFNTPLYLTIYLVTLFLLTILSCLYIFTLHYIIIMDKRVGEALKASRLLMAKHWKSFVKDYLLAILKFLSSGALLLALTVGLLWLLSRSAVSGVFSQKSWLIFSVLSVAELLAYLLFLGVPLMVGVITRLFYHYQKEEGIEVRLLFGNRGLGKGKDAAGSRLQTWGKMLLVTLSLGLIILVNAGFAVITAPHFKAIFAQSHQVEIIAHRGGGDLGAENTIEGLERAIQEKVAGVEIDVQRTRDNHYILNHDTTFKRLTGVDKKAQEMTYSEIKKLRVTNAFDSRKSPQPVASLEETLDTAKGKINLLVELKGETADKQMIDDVVKMIKARDMVKETVLLSLDYSLIQYMTKAYPEMKTGYLYYFTTGNLKDLEGDYLIMEEREATPEKIEEVQAAGKKAIVWTVNTEESINTFIHSQADGVITDYVKDVQKAVETSKKRSDLEVLLDNLLIF